MSRPDAPYPGMRPFLRSAEVNESGIFFGREAHTYELIESLAEHGFVAVVGPSGSGKSSLVRVGLVEKLMAGYLHRAGGHWAVADFAPGSKPIDALSAAVSKALDAAGGTAAQITPQAIAALLESSSGLVDLGNEVLAKPEAPNLLVIADQFEEVFQHCSTEQRVALINTLLYVFNRPTRKLYVVLTMRTDSIEPCAAYRGLPEALNKTSFLVPRLNIAEIEEALTRPAKFFKRTVGPELARVLVELMDSSDHYDPDALPLLQHAMRWLWEETPDEHTPLSLAGLRSLVGNTDDRADSAILKRALTTHADLLLKGLTAPQQEAVRSLCMLGRTTGHGGTQHRRRTTVEEVCAVSGAPEEAVLKAIGLFTDSRWSFFRWVDDGRWLEVSHEALIRNWDSLRDWAEEEDRDVAKLRDLSANAYSFVQKNLSALSGEALFKTLDWWEKKSTRDPNWAQRNLSHPADDLKRIDLYLKESKLKEGVIKLRELLGGISDGTKDCLFVMSCFADSYTRYTSPNGNLTYRGDTVSPEDASTAMMLAGLVRKARTFERLELRMTSKFQDKYDRNLLTIGSSITNGQTRWALEDRELNAPYRFYLESERYEVRCIQCEGQWTAAGIGGRDYVPGDRARPDYGIITKLNTGKTAVIVVAGLGPVGTKGAAYYLSEHWESLWEWYRDRPFGVVLKFDIGAEEDPDYMEETIVHHTDPCDLAKCANGSPPTHNGRAV